MAARTRTARKRPKALAEYQRKRDFTKTREPGAVAKRSRATLAFVIQKHAASHLHFDLRLELDGVMKSWAVPKGLSRDPSVKRLAMEVEDHPIDYNTFEGTIPKGEYGGGTVMIWDRGTYSSPDGDADAIRDSLAKGRLRFSLHGERLQGQWALVRLRGKTGREWLVIKHGDEHVVADDDLAQQDVGSIVTGRTMDEIGDAKPASAKKHEAKSSVTKANSAATVPHLDLAPMLATVGAAMPAGRDWAFEPKYDGIRVLAFVADDAVALITRNGNDKATQFPEIVASLLKLGAREAKSFVLDGEIVARTGKTLGRFQALQGRIGQTNTRTIAGHAKNIPATLVAFDLLLDGDDAIANEPWTARRAALEKLLKGRLPVGVRLGEASVGGGTRLLAKAKREGWEGIMAKLTTSTYTPGVRSRHWLKLKIEGRQEFVVGGWTEPRRSRSHIGSLLIGYWKGKRLVYAGHVGGGFTEQGLRDMHKRLAPLERKTSPFDTEPDTNEVAHWVRPSVIVEVKFNEWTNDGRLRQPVFLGVRDDKDPRTIVREKESDVAG